MFADYINERFEADELPPGAADKFEEVLTRTGAQIFKTDKGFITFELRGDAVILRDLYIKPEHRRQGEGERMHEALLALARNCGKRVMITFSEYSKKNREMGLSIIAVNGFRPAYHLDNARMFIKGI
jgi:GNAT superfamily N-acetyltransferase